MGRDVSGSGGGGPARRIAGARPASCAGHLRGVQVGARSAAGRTIPTGGIPYYNDVVTAIDATGTEGNASAPAVLTQTIR